MASHGSDAFRTLAAGWREVVPDLPPIDRLIALREALTKARSFDDILEEADTDHD
jgi:hypothetical protein